ncbi:GNAT family N-acetyltransferase [Brachyspira sp.]|uniref:GNAT family N-acetyltransferase n=1 Tax=Brachyspira sp. TaxID=1977261 RepID=UPI00262C9E4F|nr:GNAT family N-acetyltransferase [Brachyspira sp.]
MLHKGTVILEREKLLLIRFKIEDAYDNNWYNDYEVIKYLYYKIHSIIEIIRQVLTEWISQYDYKNFYRWAIAVKESNTVVRSIGTVKIDDNLNMLSIRYCISKNYWYKGITLEAFSILIKFFILII